MLRFSSPASGATGVFLSFFSLQPNRFLDWRRSQVIMTDIEGALLSDP